MYLPMYMRRHYLHFIDQKLYCRKCRQQDLVGSWLEVPEVQRLSLGSNEADAQRFLLASIHSLHSLSRVTLFLITHLYALGIRFHRTQILGDLKQQVLKPYSPSAHKHCHDFSTIIQKPAAQHRVKPLPLWARLCRNCQPVPPVYKILFSFVIQATRNVQLHQDLQGNNEPHSSKMYLRLKVIKDAPACNYLLLTGALNGSFFTSFQEVVTS